MNAVSSRSLTSLAEFTDWLTAESVEGFIGEVGWPSDVQPLAWNATAERWYDAADAANLWVTYWATGEQWDRDNSLIAYARPGDENAAVSEVRSQASIIEAHTGLGRGINVTGGAWASSGALFSNTNPGIYGTSYAYPSAETFAFLASRGIELIRLSFKWERIQPILSAPLDVTELGHLTDCVNAAGALGLGVILDCHNGGFFKTSGSTLKFGDGTLTSAKFNDLWTRLSAAFSANSFVVGYGLMNEPNSLTGGAATWETYSDACATAIRALADTKLILVNGYGFAIESWSTTHPTAWIDPANEPIRYEAHHYFDDAFSSGGNYSATFTTEVAAAIQDGF